MKFITALDYDRARHTATHGMSSSDLARIELKIERKAAVTPNLVEEHVPEFPWEWDGESSVLAANMIQLERDAKYKRLDAENIRRTIATLNKRLSQRLDELEWIEKRIAELR